MKTKYILHGGFNKERGPVQVDDEFFCEILKDTPEEVKLLLVYFAELEDIIEARIEQDTEQFERNRGSKKLNIRIASEETFEADCAWADAIYLHGGRTVKLMEILKKFPNLKTILSHGTIAGDSAGANALGKFYFRKRSKEIGEGFGILPYKIVVHYSDDTPNPLAETEPQLETVLLHEYETKVFYL